MLPHGPLYTASAERRSSSRVLSFLPNGKCSGAVSFSSFMIVHSSCFSHVLRRSAGVAVLRRFASRLVVVVVVVATASHERVLLTLLVLIVATVDVRISALMGTLTPLETGTGTGDGTRGGEGSSLGEKAGRKRAG